MTSPNLESARLAILELLNQSPGTKTRSEFTALTARQQSDFCRNGGKIVDDEPTITKPLPAGQRHVTATRAEFDAKSPAERHAYIKLGLPIRD